MAIQDAIVNTGDIDPDDADAEANNLDILIKLYTFDEADAEIASQENGEGEDESDDGFHGDSADDDNDSGDGFDDQLVPQDDDFADHGPAHRLTLLALPPGIETARVIAVPPSVPVPENGEDNEPFLIDEFPGTYALPPAQLPDSWLVGQKHDSRYH